jgi:hypothetical protein
MADIKKNANRVRGKLKVRKRTRRNDSLWHLICWRALILRISNKVSSKKSKVNLRALICEYVRHSIRHSHESLLR